MRNSVDEKTIPNRTLFERLGVNHPWLAKELKENNLFYLYAATLYAAEDAANLAFSFFSLGCAFNDSFHERNDAASAKEFHEFESTLEGLIITIVGTAFLVAFSSLGTYFADVDPKDNIYKYYLYVCWTYFRDMLKPMKWAYKGIRSTLTLILQLTNHSSLLFHLLFPITISLGILAVLARIWLRSMKSDRKLMMKQNDALCEDIYAQSNALIWLPKLPDKKDATPYINSFIYVNNELFYVYKNKTENKKEDDGEGEIQFEPVVGVDINAFAVELQTLQSENFCRQMNLYTLNEEEAGLHFRNELPVATPVNPEQETLCVESTLFVGADYANSIIYLTDPNLKTTEAFYVVDKDGRATQDVERGVRFERQLQEELKKSLNLGITAQQLFKLLPNNTNKTYSIDHTYLKWTEYKKSIEIRKQSDRLVVLCYVATMYSALIDGLYFYMGVLFVAMFCPHLFFALLAMSSVLFMVCMISRIYEEYDFQRKLHITQINVKVAASETECRFLDWMLEETFLQIDQKIQGLTQDEMIKKLYEQIGEHERLQNELEAKTVLTFGLLLVEALKSGLAFQGVISSLMFLIIALLVLSFTPCPPVVVFAFLAVGMAGFILSFAQYVISYGHYIKTLKEERDLRENGDCLHSNWRKSYAEAAGDPILQRKILMNAKIAIENHRIKPIQKFDLLGWFEVWRLFNSGVVKTEKTFGEITFNRSSGHEESWIMLLVSLIFAVLMGMIFAARTISKMFGESEKKAVVLEKFDDVSFPLIEAKEKSPNGTSKFFAGREVKRSSDNLAQTQGDGDNRLVSLQRGVSIQLVEATSLVL